MKKLFPQRKQISGAAGEVWEAAGETSHGLGRFEWAPPLGSMAYNTTGGASHPRLLRGDAFSVGRCWRSVSCTKNSFISFVSAGQKLLREPCNLVQPHATSNRLQSLCGKGFEQPCNLFAKKLPPNAPSERGEGGNCWFGACPKDEREKLALDDLELR